MSVSSVPWKTPFGIVETNQAMVRQITAATNLAEDTEAFTGEHSVGVLMPFLKYYLPRCRVVPILIDVNAKTGTMNSLQVLLTRFLKDPAVFVVRSMDFSHDSTAAVADSRDQRAERALSGLDADAVEGLHVDCHKGLRALLLALRDVGATRIRIDEHTNSSRVLGNPLQRNVTSYFSIFFGLGDEGKPAT